MEHDMGYSRHDASTYRSWSSTATASGDLRSSVTAHSFTAASVRKDFDPKQIKIRESKASDINPHPTPLIVALDVSGSMGRVVAAMHRGLGTLFEQIIDRHPITDPHVLAMAIGDMDYDRSPVQATQFEADGITIGMQIEDLYLERGGGNNDHESYLGPLYFAAMRTDCDAFKEGRKGFLFTVGDEEPQHVLTKKQIESFFGDQPREDLSAESLVSLVSRKWEYFHLIVEEGSYASHRLDKVRKVWTDLLGQRAIPLSDHTKMAEVIISLIEVTVGRDKDTVSRSWSGDTSMVVRKAVQDLMPTASPGSGPVAL